MSRTMTSDAERNLWSDKPKLSRGTTARTGYLMSEVWDDGFVCLAMTDGQLTGPALAGLQNSSVLTAAGHALPDHPTMMTRSGAAFLGRVIVEFRTGTPPVVGAIGSDSNRLLALTAARLSQH